MPRVRQLQERRFDGFPEMNVSGCTLLLAARLRRWVPVSMRRLSRGFGNLQLDHGSQPLREVADGHPVGGLDDPRALLRGLPAHSQGMATSSCREIHFSSREGGADPAPLGPRQVPSLVPGSIVAQAIRRAISHGRSKRMLICRPPTGRRLFSPTTAASYSARSGADCLIVRRRDPLPPVRSRHSALAEASSLLGRDPLIDHG
jgi:hypothetical protein